jgi:hypothetical protein
LMKSDLAVVDAPVDEVGQVEFREGWHRHAWRGPSKHTPGGRAAGRMIAQQPSHVLSLKATISLRNAAYVAHAVPRSPNYLKVNDLPRRAISSDLAWKMR